jgi:hypothetical protein
MFSRPARLEVSAASPVATLLYPVVLDAVTIDDPIHATM